TEGVKRYRSAISDDRGRVWIVTSGGVSMADPRVIATLAVRPIVGIDQVLVDGAPVAPSRSLAFTSNHQRLVVSFVGTALTVPGRIKSRYRLDNFDSRWSDPLPDRQAVYTNLPPGSYTFRVIAEHEGAAADPVLLAFRVDPMFWQTVWFRIGILSLVTIAVWAVYRVRVLQLSQTLNARFEERLAERTRIAQDLHDTLLQGFLSASMQLHVAVDSLPSDHPVGRKLQPILALVQRVIEEGRTAVRGLRSTPLDDDLEAGFRRVPMDLGLAPSVDFKIVVEGRPRPLQPLIRDDVLRIGREALANAIRHASATQIDVELDYGPRALRVS